MSGKSLYLLGAAAVIAVLSALCAYGQEALTLPEGETVAEAELDRQLKINKEMLLKGASEQMRMDAATVMLFSEEPMARQILIEVLGQSENTAARAAVCKVLSQARAAKEDISNKQQFIEPLLSMLATENDTAAALAADTILIFEYEQIAGPLEKMASDASLPVKVRLNVIDALTLQPDMRAIFKLMELTDDAQEQVAYQARQALRALAIPVGTDAEDRARIIRQLRRDGIVKFQRERLIQQEGRMRELQEQTDFWKNLYLGSLEKIYSAIVDDDEKGRFVCEHLASGQVAARLWALEKVYQARIGTKSKFSAEIGPVLINLISDPDREVRLRTAKLLSLMGELNSARRLLDQLEVEQDGEVAMELFVALGQACYYAFLPDSRINISPEIRKETLEMASKYLSDADPEKTRRGAEVIKKLLEQDGLGAGTVNEYLGQLAARYNEQASSVNGALRGELLNVMAGLCAQSVHKTEAARLFRPLFEQALRDKADLVREAAVNGLIYIDKTKALNKLRQELVNDGSGKVKEKIITLAGDVGSKEDLVWLSEKVSLAGEGQLAWEAMLKIFRRSEGAVLGDWVDRFGPGAALGGLADEQKTAFFEIAEQKVVGEGSTEKIRVIKTALARLYERAGDYNRSTRYYSLLLKDAGDAERRSILGELLGVYLRDDNIEMASQLIGNYLLEQDIDPNSIIVGSIESYLTSPEAAGGKKGEFLKALGGFEASERPNWSEKLNNWADRLGQSEQDDDLAAGETSAVPNR